MCFSTKITYTFLYILTTLKKNKLVNLSSLVLRVKYKKYLIKKIDQ